MDKLAGRMSEEESVSEMINPSNYLLDELEKECVDQLQRELVEKEQELLKWVVSNHLQQVFKEIKSS